jgi:hypothetical protein
MSLFLGSKRAGFFLLFLALIMVFTFVIDSNALGRRQLKCSAGKIVDENGNTVILRGFGLGNWLMPEGYMWKITSTSYDAPREMEAGVLDLVGGDTATANQFWRLFRANYHTEKDFCSMKAWGCNSVRISFNSTIVMPRDGQPASPPYIYKNEGWAIFDSIVAWCTRYQLWIIWDMHGAPGGQSGDNIADADGTPRLWTEPNTYWPRAIDLWKKIAQRYAENDWVVGYNLLNEPLLNKYGISRTVLRNFYVQCTDSIRKIDSKGLLFIDGDNYAQNFSELTPPWDPQVVYSFHCYPPCCSYFGLEAYQTQYGTPLWHGETGESGATDPYTIYTNCVNKLETHNPPIGWAWWTLKKFSNTTQPYSIAPTTGFQKIITYWNSGGTKPSVDSAKVWLLDMAVKTNTESSNVTYLPNMVNSLKLNGNAKCVVCTKDQTTSLFSKLKISQNIDKSGRVVLSFTMPYSCAAKISIYDLNGKLQKVLVNSKNLSSGEHNVIWDKKDKYGKNISKGIYIYRIDVNNEVASKQMALIN